MLPGLFNGSGVRMRLEALLITELLNKSGVYAASGYSRCCKHEMLVFAFVECGSNQRMPSANYTVQNSET